MADANINAPEVLVAAASPPTRSDEQILPRNKWVPVGKRNCFLDVERTQANPIFKIAVDILKNTNFFKAFTASSTIPSIYIQQFWDTIRFDKDKGYSCQLDEQHFYLTKSTLRDVLQLPQDNNNFSHPPNVNTIISFVNTSAFERPRAPVLQILWGVVNRENIDYAERIWEEFTQCSPLHLPYEEFALRYPKLSFKNTKRVRFGMAIPDTLISENIRSATYYPEYVAKVANYQRYLAGEVVSDDEASATKPAKGAKHKTTRKSKPQSPKTTPVAKPTASKISKSTSSQPSKPKPAPAHAKPREKKIKLVLDAAEAPSQAKRSKADEGVSADEPRFGDEEVDMRKAVEESLKDAYVAPRGPLPLVVIREPEPGKYQPLPEVQGKGKEKVGEEQAAQVLLNL
ncbi:hypothetical protein Tco_1334412 [Tanacetum coccineum]